jgi:hypothetical protein
MDVSVIVYEDNGAVHVATAGELDDVIRVASEEARAKGMLNIIFIEAANGNSISMAVGGSETVLGFTHNHRNPPYYATRGPVAETYPLMTCYVGLVHHTEFPRKYVIPFADGVVAAHEFAESGALPTSVAWMET